MFITNNLFFNSISKILLKSNELDKSLMSILEKGILEINGLTFLAEFYNTRFIPNNYLIDDVDKEIFINNFHSDDYLCCGNFYNHWLNMILFCKLLPDYLPKNRNYLVCVILTQTEFGVNFKMYKDRKVEYLSENLDVYNQEIIKIIF